MTAYYNEHDKYAAQWLRNLIEAGQIAHGIVDERSIEDVFPSDLRGFTQCHFFAGIGVWSHALRQAGWADDRPIWSGSCPCQPFSAAGAGTGFDDERHLWPAFHHLIAQCKPSVVVGEQVASRDADPWLDLVSADMEALGFAFGAVAFPTAGVGGPHIRDRTYWVAHASGPRSLPGAPARVHRSKKGAGARHGEPQRHSAVVGLAHTRHNHDASQVQTARAGQPQADRPADQLGGCGASPCGMVNPESSGRAGQPLRTAAWGPAVGIAKGDGLGGLADAERQRVCTCGQGCADGAAGAVQGIDGQRQRVWPDAGAGDDGVGTRPGPVHGFWADVDWLLCRDGKWRPVEPGTFPLVDGVATGMGRGRADWHTPAGPQGFGHRAGRLKGYGNAINAEAARVFVECVMEAA